jgi:hypothetical protein
MVSWALAQEPSRFVDPGTSSGRFAVGLMAMAFHRPVRRCSAGYLGATSTTL